MGCFCHRVALPPIPTFNASLALLPDASLVAAVSSHLSLRWLPPAIPWHPDPAWLELKLPTLRMPAASLSVLLNLVMARQAILLAFKLDVLIAADLLKLQRIVLTLNLRTDLLTPLSLDWRPWLALGSLLHQVTTVRLAITAGLFLPSLDLSGQVPLTAPWRGLLLQVKALAPLAAIAATLKLNLADPAWSMQLAAIIRPLRLVLLPLLAAPGLVLQLVAQVTAMAQLHLAFGPLPFPQLRAALVLRLQEVLQLLPPGIRLVNGQLLGMPNLLPNPSLILNAPTISAVAKLSATAQLNWQVPAFAQLPLLTVGAPVAALIAGWPALNVGSAIRLSPCGPLCDAAAAVKALATA